MLNFANSTVGYKNSYCLVSIKFYAEKMWITCGKICNNVFVGILLLFLGFSKSDIPYFV